MKKLITTPIYYVNAAPHIGHTYTTIIADTLARYYRLIGDDVIFSTGTDEHGEKIEISAKNSNKTPQEFSDEVSAKFKDLWDKFEISYDEFIRTTKKEHIKAVKYAFKKMFEKGDIYKGEYEGFYCVSCESFYTASQLIDNKFCPDCSKETKILKEESYFFKLSKYEDKLKQWLNEKDVITPASKKNEILNFINSGLKDLSITRTSFSWGIPLPDELNDNKHIIYVWLDALINYISILGYPKEDKMEFLSGAIQIVGKDILKFHAIYWPAFLMSLELPLPNKILSHGWWLVKKEKMSKSKGNSIDPLKIANLYGVDELRYYLLKEISFGQDGDFSEELLINKINSDLNNDLGNLLSRTIGMAKNYNDLDVIKLSGFEEELNLVEFYSKRSLEYLKKFEFSKYLEEIWNLIHLANATIAKYEPWNLIKNNKKQEALNIISLNVKILANVSILLSFAMPRVAKNIAYSLDINIDKNSFDEFIIKNKILSKRKLKPTSHIFKKIDKDEKKEEVKVNYIKIDEFKNLVIKVGEVLECERVEGSDKLLKFRIDLGDGDIRQIVSGIAKYYNPDDLIGKQICVLSNLKPAKIFKIQSEGMILSAESGDELSLITPLKRIKNGSIIG